MFWEMLPFFFKSLFLWDSCEICAWHGISNNNIKEIENMKWNKIELYLFIYLSQYIRSDKDSSGKANFSKMLQGENNIK